jgi:hypothetical protein
MLTSRIEEREGKKQAGNQPAFSLLSGRTWEIMIVSLDSPRAVAPARLAWTP